jgi:hypothetical protein
VDRRSGPRRILTAVYLWWLPLDLLLAACQASVPIPSPTPAEQLLVPSPSRTTATLQPTPTSTRTPPATATLGPTPPGGAAELIFGVVERIGEQYAYGPILRYQVVEGRIQTITSEGYEFLGLSPSGDRVLARAQSRLVLLDLAGAESARITDHLLDSGVKTAVWVPETDSVVYIEDGAETRLRLYDAATQAERELEGTNGALELIQPSNVHSVVWLAPPCSSDGRCESPWAVDLVTGTVRALTDLLRPTVDPTGTYLAFLYPDDQQRRRLALAPADRSRTIRPGVPGDNILDYVWSPDGTGLLVVALVRSDYSGRWFGSRQFIITPGTWVLRELPQTDTANALGVWSPDGHAVVLAGTQPDPSGYVVTLRRIDLNSRKVEVLDPGVSLARPNYVFVSMMAWRPLR